MFKKGHRVSAVLGWTGAVMAFFVVFAALDIVFSLTWPSPLRFRPHGELPRMSPSIRTFRRAADRLREIRFTFEPSERTRMVRLFFGLDREAVDGSFSCLSLSATSDLPSTFLRYRDGQPAERIELSNLTRPFAQSHFRILFGEERASIMQDGRARSDVPLSSRDESVHLALYPSYPLAYLRPDYAALPLLEMDVEKDGQIRRVKGWRPWAVHWARPLLALALAAIVLGTSARSPRMRSWFAGGFALVLLSPLVLFMVFGIRFCAREERQKYRLVETLDPARGAGTLRINDHDHRVQLDPDLINLIALGGSTTHGDPYALGEGYDYPNQLERLLNASNKFGGRRFQVLNLGKVGIDIGSLAELLGLLVPRVHPRAVLVSSVYNNYFHLRPHMLAFHAAGWSGVRSAASESALGRYERSLRCMARMTRGNGSIPVWIEEFIDRSYFQGENILAPFQERLERVAHAEKIPLIPFQRDADADPDRLIFYEYIHPSSLGYRWMAERIARWFEANAAAVLSPSAEGRASITSLEIPECRDL